MKQITIVEVGPRDGLQNEKQVISTEDKVEYIKKLIASGIKSFEVTSFMHPKKVPQMADAEDVLKQLYLMDLSKDLYLYSMIPNLKGMQRALGAGVRDIAILTAASDSFNKRNINFTIDESIAELEKVIEAAKNKGINIRGDIATVFGCPFEGEISLDNLKKVIQKFIDFGCVEISLADTVGIADIEKVELTLQQIKADFDLDLFSAHFHGDKDNVLANVKKAFDLGITRFDSAAGGIGGCPFAPKPVSNLATEDIVAFCHSLNIKTGIDQNKLYEASRFITEKLQPE